MKKETYEKIIIPILIAIGLFYAIATVWVGTYYFFLGDLIDSWISNFSATSYSKLAFIELGLMYLGHLTALVLGFYLWKKSPTPHFKSNYFIITISLVFLFEITSAIRNFLALQG